MHCTDRNAAAAAMTSAMEDGIGSHIQEKMKEYMTPS